jgi:hypothetical protein
MTTTTTPPPSTRPKGLLALKVFLLNFLLWGAPVGTPKPYRSWVFPRALSFLFVSEGYVATVLCNVLPGILAKIVVQRLRGKAACGGWKHPNRFTKADLVQTPADLAVLMQMSSAALCELLFVELRALIRLIRETQREYWKQEQRWWLREAWQKAWRARHGALLEVLRRIVHICARLRERANGKYAEQCLRWQVRLVWEDLFGPNVPQTSAVWRWMEPVKLTARQERYIVWRLRWEQAQGHPIPEIFADLLETAGE